MSRIGKKPVAIPAGVKLKLDGSTIEVSGKVGTLKHTLNTENLVAIKTEGSEVVVTRKSEDKRAHAVQGLIRALIGNMVVGVSEGYTKMLDMVGVGYKMELKGDNLSVAAGLSHIVQFPVPAGLKMTIENKGTRITIAGADKWLVGETAARIRRIRPPEPYKGKGIRYVGEQIKRKVGKTAAGAGAGG